ncbi:MAG: M23 family metallopeptidase [Deltaproteobacteria bacterium]|nr:M23 family metallopeptidase [Deltaproteobacteria bacterium]
MLTIEHGYGVKTKYAHLQKTLVKKGQYIKRGETVALVGNTGRSTGPHLHYEVHLNRVAVNPLRYILN